jgi:hypothetical protein
MVRNYVLIFCMLPVFFFFSENTRAEHAAISALATTVVNGRPTGNGVPTVLIKSEDDAGKKFVCTGIPVLGCVISAGHCEQRKKFRGARIYTGENPDLNKPGIEVVDAESLGNSISGGQDLTVLKMAAPPASFVEIQTDQVFGPRDGTASKVEIGRGEIYGYGVGGSVERDDGTFESTGVGRRRMGTVDYVGRGKNVGDRMVQDPTGNLLLAKPNPSAAGEGDSGGPLVVNDKVVGIASGELQTLPTSASERMFEGDKLKKQYFETPGAANPGWVTSMSYTPISDHREWIEKTLAKLGCGKKESEEDDGFADAARAAAYVKNFYDFKGTYSSADFGKWADGKPDELKALKEIISKELGIKTPIRLGISSVNEHSISFRIKTPEGNPMGSYTIQKAGNMFTSVSVGAPR